MKIGSILPNFVRTFSFEYLDIYRENCSISNMFKYSCFASLLVSSLICMVLFRNHFKVNADETKVYEPNWKSLDSRPLPQWYDDAKIGIFLHWGVYSVPSIGTEWFWTNWRNSHVESYESYMKNNFKPGFTYQEFAPKFTAEHFDASEWADLFNKSGAKYINFKTSFVEKFQ